eukprot:CAMPEP_0194223494 /NCGR_PEP_ID=MMETSP0156-20130528/35273_1 /TAXON_ID=33649 /ORGANISM="Thalassionema nitzschioides, Strain L26-B" /LENGTH=515 /DNA_ID=CAMNT_0038954667 /DNA_START=185 /DNA_END=1732 /DNA_ORIENTATION=-
MPSVLFSTPTNGGYVPTYETATGRKKKALYPNAGDIVRYYDLDGGKPNGQVLVGKITYIEEVRGSGKSNTSNQWTVEIVELEDVGDGYFAEYGFRQRSGKKSLRNLNEISPIAASFVRSEYAYKIPRNKEGLPTVRREQYDIDTYEGPLAYKTIDFEVVEADRETYDEFKGKLLRQTAIIAAGGALTAILLKGPQDAVAYIFGAAGGIFYLFFLYIKTDTIGSAEAKYGKSISNVRFAAPFLSFAFVAIFNMLLGEGSPMIGKTTMFSTITSDQFAATVVGFLTYRLPLLSRQISEMFSGGEELTLPGSAGIAMKLSKREGGEQVAGVLSSLKTVMLVSGPKAAGRTELVDRLIAECNDRFVRPNTIDRINDGANFERLENRNEILMVDGTGRYGITEKSIINTNTTAESAIVIDADVGSAQEISRVAGLRVIGVWVGLDATKKFEDRLKEQLATGALSIPDGETESAFLRTKVDEIVKDIEIGVLSGMFEFTILNDDVEQSVKELKEAAEYCFK